METENASKQDRTPDAKAAPAAQAAPAPPATAPQWAPQPQMPPQPWTGYYAQPPAPRPPREPIVSNKPSLVGGLLVLVGVLGIIMWSIGLAGFSMFGDMMDGNGNGPYEIEGVVEYTNGTGASGANVTLVGTSISTVTDNEGNFVLYNVPKGDQRIEVSKAGYVTLVRKVAVTGDMMSGWSWTDSQSTHMGPELRFTLSPGTGQAEIGSFESDFEFGDIQALVAVCAVIGIVLSILAIIGGLNAFKKTNFGMVMLGTLAGLFTIGFGIGSVLAFVALFILLIASDEFKGKASSA